MFVTYIYFILICVLSLDNVNIANINFRVPNIFNRFGNGVIKYKNVLIIQDLKDILKRFFLEVLFLEHCV